MKHATILFVLLVIAFSAASQQYNNIYNPPQLTGLTGGGATNLDGVLTENLPVGSMISVFDGTETRMYCLTAGTDAEDSPSVIRPDDFSDPDNAKVWKLRLSSDPEETGYEIGIINKLDAPDGSPLDAVFVTNAGNVGIGTVTPDPSAALEVSSTNKGFMPPRMSNAEREEIVSPAAGLIIYNTDNNSWQGYNGSEWRDFETTMAGLVFRDDFNGSTFFTTTSYPFGDPLVCGNPNTVVFSNSGTEQIVEMGCYDEAELSIILGLPFDDYTIKLSWRSGNDPHSYISCTHTQFDDHYGASCSLPNRMIVVNDAVIYEKTSLLTSFSEVAEIPYTGAINSLKLCIASAGTDTPYYTYYDYIIITN